MKTTLIFTAVILFAAFMGCSDNLSLNDPLNMDSHSGQTSQTRNPGTHDVGSVEVVWSQDELLVKTVYEAMVENKAAYIIPPLQMGPYSYMITFKAYTNADRVNFGYGPVAQITKDGELIFEGTSPESINGSHEIRLDNVRANEIKFYTALYQVDNSRRPSDPREPSNLCVLKLSNINVYRID